MNHPRWHDGGLDEEQRKAYWKTIYPNLRDWRILEIFHSRSNAQKFELKKA